MSVESQRVQSPRSSFESRFIGEERNVYNRFQGTGLWNRGCAVLTVLRLLRFRVICPHLSTNERCTLTGGHRHLKYIQRH